MFKAIILAAATAALLTGCATVWSTLGVATVRSVEEDNAALALRIDDLAARVDSGAAALAKAAELERLVRELEGRMDQLPADTLDKLAGLLAKAAEEARRAARN